METILIVEDEAEIRESIQDILELKNYRVISAPNGKEGYIAALKHKPALIISDIMMPETDGYEMLSLLKMKGLLINVPFIFLTAKTQTEDLRKGMNIGADDYLFKPFKAKELLSVVHRHIKQSNDRKDYYEAKAKKLINELNKTTLHEFNTPLNGIIGFSSIMKTNPNLNKNIFSKYLDFISSSALRLSRTINNITLYQELAGNTHKTELFDGHTSWEEIVEWTEDTANFYKRPEDLFLENVSGNISGINKRELKTIITELTDNAFKFSDTGTPVTITLQNRHGYSVFSISDQGRGMSETQIQQIAPFTQFERKKYEQQGMGLGLYIAKELCTHYDLPFEISSQLGQGVSCSVIIPVKH